MWTSNVVLISEDPYMSVLNFPDVDESQIDYPAIPQRRKAVPFGTQIRRMTQVSNGTNSTVLSAGVVTPLQLNGDGSFNKDFNNPQGYGSPDYGNNWFDIRNLHPRAHLSFRVTVTNNAGATTPVSGANIVVRIINDINNPSVVIDAPSIEVTFKGQGQFNVTAYSDSAQAIQICMKTSANENIRTNGIYLSIDDVVP